MTNLAVNSLWITRTPGGGAWSLPQMARTMARSIRHSREHAMSALLCVGAPKVCLAQRLIPLKEWNSRLLYAFPPIPLLPRVLKKIRTNRAQFILVAPDWARRVWYPELLGMSICPPIGLPLQEDLLSQQQGRILHLSLRTLHLHAWRLIDDC
mgnify:CR=1 FL=1